MDFENLIRSPLELSRLNKKRSTFGSVFSVFSNSKKGSPVLVNSNTKACKNGQMAGIFYLLSFSPNVII